MDRAPTLRRAAGRDSRSGAALTGMQYKRPRCQSRSSNGAQQTEFLQRNSQRPIQHQQPGATITAAQDESPPARFERISRPAQHTIEADRERRQHDRRRCLACQCHQRARHGGIIAECLQRNMQAPSIDRIVLQTVLATQAPRELLNARRCVDVRLHRKKQPMDPLWCRGKTWQQNLLGHAAALFVKVATVNMFCLPTIDVDSPRIRFARRRKESSHGDRSFERIAGCNPIALLRSR